MVIEECEEGFTEEREFGLDFEGRVEQLDGFA